ncbi:MAG TPA: hypothetical protein PK313_07980, partial [Myxococcota bacterium]|nr:hypothetical protein [Myxococcota bacterium]
DAVPAGAILDVALRILDRKRRKDRDPDRDLALRTQAREVLQAALQLGAGDSAAAAVDLLVAARFFHAHRPKSGGD